MINVCNFYSQHFTRRSYDTGNTIYVVGKDKISKLFDIDEDTIEPQPAEEIAPASEDQSVTAEPQDEKSAESVSPGSFTQTEETETIRITAGEKETRGTPEIVDGEKKENVENKSVTTIAEAPNSVT